MEKFFLVTIFRLGKYENIFMRLFLSSDKNLDEKLCDFVLYEKESGHETCIINKLEITKTQYQNSFKL